MSVTIIAAAIRLEGRVWSVPQPGRHHDVIRLIYEETGNRVPGTAIQGFLTSEGEFVNRYQAHRIVELAGQPCKRRVSYGSELYSEDVW